MGAREVINKQFFQKRAQKGLTQYKILFLAHGDDHHGHDHGHSHSHDGGHTHGEACASGGCGSSASTPWNILPWEEVRASFEPTLFDASEYPTVVSNCQSIADWDAALQHGTLEVNAVDERGLSGFHYAVQRGNLNLVKYLLSRNADAHKVTEDGKASTALHLAVESGDMATLQHILGTRGISVDARDSDGQTAAHLATRTGRLVQLTYLLRYNSSFIDIQDAEGSTLLHTAILYGSYNCMKQILAHHPNVFLYDKSGCTPLHQALKTSNPHAVILLADYDMNQFSKATKEGQSPLGLSLESGDDTLRTIVRQYSSMANFPRWFKDYMWHLSSASWLAIFLVLSWFINFWIMLAAAAFGMRTLYNLTQSESFKTSKNPLILSGVLSTLIASFFAFIYWVMPTTGVLSIAVVFLTYLSTVELLRRTYSRDPGFHRYSADDTMAFAIAAKTDSPAAAPIATLCETCLGDRPQRTKHCSKCGLCVDGAQHHCTALNICVAKNNHVSFFLFLLSAATLLSFWLLSAFDYLLLLTPDESIGTSLNAYAMLRHFVSTNPVITILSILAASALGYTIFMIVTHALRIAKNITAYEQANWERYDYMHDSEGNFVNPYDKGISGNIQLFLSGANRTEASKAV